MPKYVDDAGLSRFWDNIKGQIGSASDEQIAAWLEAHPEATTTVQDGAVTTAKLAGELANAIYSYEAVPVSAYPNGWALTGTGPCVADASSMIVKYAVTAGDMLRLSLSADNAGVYQWQNNASVPSNSNPYVIGTPVTKAVDGIVVVPQGATYLIVSQHTTNTSNSVQLASPLKETVTVLKDEYDVNHVTPEMKNGTLGNGSNTDFVAMTWVLPANDAQAFRVTTDVPLGANQKYYWLVATYSVASGVTWNNVIFSYDPYEVTTEPYIDIYNDGPFVGFGVALALVNQDGTYSPLRIANTGNCLTCRYYYSYAREALAESWLQTPVMANGTIGSSAVTYAMAMQYSIATHGASEVVLKYVGDLNDGDVISWQIKTFKTQENRYSESYIRKIDGDNEQVIGNGCVFRLLEDEAYIAIGVIRRDKDGNGVELGAANGYAKCVVLRFLFGDGRVGQDTLTALRNARHVPHPLQNTVSPALTLLHFSDIHDDRAALRRIVDDADRMGDLVDGIICTGDMRANAYGEIASWWDASVMTCIGNHDTASYSSGSYNWTALPMAERDSNYIAPFEANWGVIHSSGTSYYYKDYTSSKVRLIVLDAMLYTGTSNASEASTQTSWLSSLLSSATTAGLHVLIAAHAPHNGSTALPCNFTKLNQGTRPEAADCQVPQSVVDVVASAINSGLDFIGYIVGHTHQDAVWDAEGNGKQLMYCVTCAATANENQWLDSDQDRSDMTDAYNLVTIDTNNKLVKLVRGGGADVDNAMRPRRMLCVNYETGTIVDQEL